MLLALLLLQNPGATNVQAEAPVIAEQRREIAVLCTSRATWLRDLLATSEMILISHVEEQVPNEGGWKRFPTLDPHNPDSKLNCKTNIAKDGLKLLAPEALWGTCEQNLTLPFVVYRGTWFQEEEGPANWIDGRVLSFLKKTSLGWVGIDPAPNGLRLDVAREKAMRAVVQKWEPLRKGKDRFATRELFSEWIMELARHPYTRPFAVRELDPFGCRQRDHRPWEICFSALDLTMEQKDELFELLLNCDEPGFDEIQLYEALRDSNDPRLIDFLVNAIAAGQWRADLPIQPRAELSIRLHRPRNSHIGTTWLGELVYDAVTRSHNKAAWDYFRVNWKGRLGDWSFIGTGQSHKEAVNRIVVLIRREREC